MGADWKVLLNTLGKKNGIDMRRVAVDGSNVLAKKWGQGLGPNPTDRGRNGTKHHLAVDARGVPIALALSPANVNDSKMMIPLLDAMTPIQREVGHDANQSNCMPILLLA